MLEAIAALSKGDVLLVAKRDRIGRLEPMQMAMIEAAVARKGSRIVSANGEGTQDDSPENILMRRMVDAFAEYERLVIQARTRSALNAKRTRGEKTGGAVPFGKQLGEPRLGAKGKLIPTLIDDPREQEVIALVRQLRAEGETLVDIGRTLEERGIRRREGAQWDHGFLSRLLERSA
jgi:DNA invertase Pin-like site-specific DNA recombinase